MIVMEGTSRLNLEQMSSFLAASTELELGAPNAGQARQTVAEVLSVHRYGKLGKAEKGTIRRYLMRVTGYERAQITRLIRQYRDTGNLPSNGARRRKFPTRYSRADIELLALVDTAQQGLSGAAVRHILKRGWNVYGDPRYERLAGISVSHIYNLRGTETYRRHRAVYRPTQNSPVSIGERRCPDPKGAPGWIRIDTVHQGDPRNGHAGLYHINAVDTVTQWQIAGCVETISERHLLPVLEAMMHQFPFQIRGFHSDNGSEFINYQVANLLEKLRIGEFTKSRAYKTTDNALVEGKNGSVIRKHIGYGHLAGKHAETFQRFYTLHLNPYLNFHRPCGYATILVNERGKRRRRYRPDDYRTPFEKLKTIPEWQGFLKEAIGAGHLEQKAASMTDMESAERMQKARNEILVRCRADEPGSELIPG